MTQAEEALAMMSCRMCGRFSGPELLCSSCELAMDAAYAAEEVAAPGTMPIRCARCDRWFTIPATPEAEANAVLCPACELEEQADAALAEGAQGHFLAPSDDDLDALFGDLT